MNSWDRLRARYSSKGQYLKRKVLFSYSDFDDFQNWLIDQGADVLANPKQDEALRFKLNGELGIVYSKGSGNLLAHDLGHKYSLSVGHDSSITNASNVSWNLSTKSSAPQKSKRNQVVFEYCFSCKDIQELYGDQCSVCHSYIKY